MNERMIFWAQIFFGIVGIICRLGTLYTFLKSPDEATSKEDNKHRNRFINFFSLFLAALAMLGVLAVWPV